MSDDRRRLLEDFAESYRRRRFDPSHYDLDGGFLQTTLSDDRHMPLRFFVEYNNAWWFEIVTSVQVPVVGHDPSADAGFVVLEIHYGDQLFHAAQRVGFGAGVIDRIRTYASSSFFDRPDPLVELDRSGNALWLETGYDLARSARAAREFLDAPAGRAFAAAESTATPVARIRRNVDDLLARL